MAGRKAIKSINWSALAELIPESERTSFAALKAKSDQYLKRVQENPESPPKINWSFYKSKIGVPGLVDKFQKEYESLKIAYPQDKYTSQIDAFEKEVNSHIQTYIEQSNKRITEYQAKIKELEGLLSYGQMTMEDFNEAHPELAFDQLKRPTIFPHTPEFQPGTEEEVKPATQH